jgi:hypothetical protein
MAGTSLCDQDSHTVCSGDSGFSLLAPATREANKQFIATRMGHVTKEKTRKNKNIFHGTSHAISSSKIKQGGRSKWDKKEVRAEQRLIKPHSLVLSLVLSNSSVCCVLILCKTNYLITRIARLVMSDVQQLTGWWRKLHENCL